MNETTKQQLLPVYRTRISGTVTIIDENGNKYVYKNQVQQSFIQAILQYAQGGGTPTNYSYTIALLNNNTLLGEYVGSLTYRQVSTTLQAIFTFIIPNAPSNVNILQLNVSSSITSVVVAQVQNVRIPSGILQIVWTINFDISPADYFTPYLIFAFISPPSKTVQFIGAPLPNTQMAITEIQNNGYLTTPVNYYITYNGQYIQLQPKFTYNSIFVYYQFPITNQATTYSNVALVASATNGYVNLVIPLQQMTVQVGQVATAVYSAVWQIPT